MQFSDRAQAGHALAERVQALGFTEPPVVLAITPGAVPVAFEVAHALHAELDLLEVRPFAARGQPDRELGIVASGGIRVVHGQVQSALNLSDEAVAEASAQAAGEIHTREHQWRRRHPRPTLSGRPVVFVTDVAGPDARLDGAVLIARSLGAARVIAAATVGLGSTVDQVRADADEVVVLNEVDDAKALASLGWQAPDDAEVRTLLERAEEWRAPVLVE